MRLLIVNPPRVGGFPVVREERFEHRDIGSVYAPLSLLYCAAVARRAGHEVSVLDANGRDLGLKEVEKAFDAFKPGACLVRLGFDTQEPDLLVLKAAKARGIATLCRLKIIGDVPALRDGLMLAHPEVDVFFHDEPEFLLQDALKALQDGSPLEAVPGITFRGANGTPVSTPLPGRLPDPDNLPFPAYDLLPGLQPYHTGVFGAPFTMVQTSRGCPFHCSFCAFGKLPYRKRDVAKVADELSWLKEKFGLKHFLFFDDVLTLDMPRVEKLMNLMIERKLDLKWACCTRANLLSRDLLALMKKAGCEEIAIGIESGSEDVLRETEKGVTKDDMRAAARWCHELGILFYGLAIVGLPGETEATVEDTISFINEIRPFYTQFSFCVPFPNTETFGWFKDKGLLLTQDWSRYFPLDERPVARTLALGAEDLIRLRRRMYLKTTMRPANLLKAIRWTDPMWNIRGAIKVMGRFLDLVKGKAMR